MPTELEQRVLDLEAELARAPDDRHRAPLLLCLGTNLEAIGQAPRGLDALRRARLLFDQLGDARGALEARNSTGSVLIALRRMDDARAELEIALAGARALGASAIEATSLNNLAIVDEITGDFDRARVRYEESIAILRADPDAREKLATTLNNLGVTYEKLALDDFAHAAWREAIATAKAIGHDSCVASTLNNVSLFLSDRGHAADALAYAEQAVAIQERRGDKRELALMLGNLAGMYSELDRHAEAVPILERQLAIVTDIGADADVAQTLHVLADTLRSLGLDPDAYRTYERAVRAFAALGDLANMAHAEMDQASVAPDSRRALAHGENALAVRIALGDLEELGAALDNLGGLYGESGDHARAIDLMERSLAVTEECNDIAGRGTVLHNLASACARAKLVGRALDYYERALVVAPDAASRQDILDALDELRGHQA